MLKQLIFIEINDIFILEPCAFILIHREWLTAFTDTLDTVRSRIATMLIDILLSFFWGWVATTRSEGVVGFVEKEKDWRTNTEHLLSARWFI